MCTGTLSTACGKVAAVVQTDDYTRHLDELLLDVARTTPDASFGRYVAGTDGAFPGDVVERLAALGLRWRVEDSELEPTPQPNPELHALDFEWLFSAETAHELADSLASSESVLLGLPTVAARMPTRFTLVEKNPFTLLRDPALSDRGTVLLKDVRDAKKSLKGPAKAVGFDPPWYLNETLLWLSIAAEISSPGGTIQFVLFPAMIRPEATRERGLILAACASVGNVTVQESRVQYVTPRFELEAMRAANAPALTQWRRGDLVTIHVGNPREFNHLESAEPLPGSEWRRYRIGTRVIKLRPDEDVRTVEQDLRIERVEGLRTWTLPSVSLRAEARSSANIWTSRNRVADVPDVARTDRLLRRLSRLRTPDAVKRFFRGYEWASKREEAEAWYDFLDVEDLGRWSLRQCTNV
jgi:hypothetical protein